MANMVGLFALYIGSDWDIFANQTHHLCPFGTQERNKTRTLQKRSGKRASRDEVSFFHQYLT